MKKMEWFERQFTFGLPAGMLPFYLERLGGTLARIEKKTTGIKEDILSHKLNGKWSVKENIAHLAEVDEIALKRIDEMKQGVSPMSPAMIQPGRDYNAQSIDEVIRFFKTNRDKNLQKYKSLDDEDLNKSSLHPRLKILMTPVDLAWFDAEHDDHHLERVNEILKTLLK
jgi:uncharacterized damage-inducible protein DinB